MVLSRYPRLGGLDEVGMRFSVVVITYELWSGRRFQ